MIPVFLDFETYYAKDFTLKKLSTQEYIYDPRFKVHGVGCAIAREEPRWFSGPIMRKLLERVVPGNVIVAHNATGFDVPILEWVFKLKPKFIIDTCAMSRALIGERLRSHSLDSVAQYLFKIPKGTYLGSTMGQYNLSPEQEAKLAGYCATDENSDVRLCRSIFYALIPHMPRRELPIMDMVARMNTEPKLWLDTELLIQYHSEVVARKLIALDEAGIKDASEVRSNPQFADALRRLGVEPPTKESPTVKNADGTPAIAYAFAKTDEGLQALQEHPDERVQALVAARLENKSTLAESRADKFITASRYGEFPVEYLYSGAQTTHRLSGGGGFNMQNLPRGGPLRQAIMAPAGHVLVVGDLRQIELRATLCLATEFVRLNGFNETKTEEYKALHMLAAGASLYCDFGTELYGETITKENHPDKYHISKECVLGSGYQMGAPKLVKYLQGKGVFVDKEFAQRAIDVYRGRFKGIVALWAYLQQIFKNAIANQEQDYQLFKIPDVWLTREPIYKDRAVRIPPTGLHVKYPGLRTRARTETEMGGLCYDRARDGTTGLFGGKILQNMIECLTRNIIMEKSLEIRKRYPVVMQTHDEKVSIVPQEQEQEGTKFITEVFEKQLDWWPSLPLNAEVKSAVRYGEAK